LNSTQKTIDGTAEARAGRKGQRACLSRPIRFNHGDPLRMDNFLPITPYREKTMAKAATPTKPLTKTELLANIAAAAELPKTQVAAVLEALAAEIQKSLGNKGAGAITIPGLVKIEKKRVPARKAEKGVPNPFKPGELMDRPAKPAYNKVKVRALKLLKDMAK